MDSKTLALIAVVIAAALFLGVFTPGAFGTSGQIQSISQTTLDSKSAAIITTLAYSGGASFLTATVNTLQWSGWKGDQVLGIGWGKLKDTYSYSLSERSGASKGVSKYLLSSFCTGNNPLDDNSCVRKYAGKGFSQFKAECRASNTNNIAIDVGDAVTPQWKCYSQTPRWIISDFDRIGGVYSPAIWADARLYSKDAVPGFGDYTQVAQVELDNTVRSARLIATDGTDLGEVRMDALVSTFNTPPSASGIKAIRTAQGGSYLLTDASVDAEVGNIKNSFQTCMQQSQKSSGGIVTINFGPFGIAIAESYTPAAVDCINKLSQNVENIKNLKPAGDFGAPDTQLDASKLDSERKITITNKYTIPILRYTLFAGGIQLTTPKAKPIFVSCATSTAQVPGGARSSLQVTAVNDFGGAGPIEYGVSCQSPITVLTPSGAIDFQPGERKTWEVPFTTGSQAGTYPCTVTAKSSDGKTSLSSSCSITQTGICSVVPKTGCYVDANCVEQCPKPNICTDGTAINECNTNTGKKCSLVGGIPTLQDDASCKKPSNETKLQCLPFIQKVKTEWVGGFLGIGATQVQTCENDLVGIGAVVLVVLGGLYLWRRRV